MKENIDAIQLNQLSDKGKERLREWWIPSEGDKLAYIDNSGIDDLSTDWLIEYDGMWYFADADSLEKFVEMIEDNHTIFPLLSIGQMIQFLDEHVGEYLESRYQIGWITKTMCDDLWEQVKEILEKE